MSNIARRGDNPQPDNNTRRLFSRRATLKAIGGATLLVFTNPLEALTATTTVAEREAIATPTATATLSIPEVVATEVARQIEPFEQRLTDLAATVEKNQDEILKAIEDLGDKSTLNPTPTSTPTVLATPTETATPVATQPSPEGQGAEQLIGSELPKRVNVKLLDKNGNVQPIGHWLADDPNFDTPKMTPAEANEGPRGMVFYWTYGSEQDDEPDLNNPLKNPWQRTMPAAVRFAILEETNGMHLTTDGNPGRVHLETDDGVTESEMILAVITNQRYMKHFRWGTDVNGRRVQVPENIAVGWWFKAAPGSEVVVYDLTKNGQVAIGEDGKELRYFVNEKADGAVLFPDNGAIAVGIKTTGVAVAPPADNYNLTGGIGPDIKDLEGKNPSWVLNARHLGN